MQTDQLPDLQTDRLFLRPQAMADLEASVAMDTDPEVMRYIGPVPDADERRTQIAAWIEEEREPGVGLWSVFLKEAPDDFLGWAALIHLDGSADIEVGYRFKRPAWGKGYATESGRAVLDYGFMTLALDEIVAVVHPENARSQRVMDKLGLVRDGMRLAYGSNLLFYRLNRDTFRQSLDSP